MLRKRQLVTVVILLVAVSAVAQRPALPGNQQGPPPAPLVTGTVTGRVICADTQRPARFAEVILTAVAAGEGNQRGRARVVARTDADGMFAANAPVGEYYATGLATGYVSQIATMQAGLNANNATNADVQAALARLPVVHVSAGVSSTVNMTLERGAVIAGKATWDDGSPAAGVTINAAAQTASGGQGIDVRAQLAQVGFGGFNGGFGDETDDRGQFRVVGLAPGTYLLRAVIVAPSPVNGPIPFSRITNIVLYAPGKVRKADAAAITVGGGEERSDVTFVLDLRSLHKVSGHVNAVAGGVAIGSGTVRLVDSQDSSLMRTAQIGVDGSYNLMYVPAGTYTLSVPSAGPAPVVGVSGFPRGRPDVGSTAGASYQPFQETVTVADSDVSGLDVELAPATAAK